MPPKTSSGTVRRNKNAAEGERRNGDGRGMVEQCDGKAR
jgi:hypothetical protein